MTLLYELNWIKLFSFIVASFLLLIIYFKIANYFNILDKPNNRSSHNRDTIRGAGFIFPLIFISNNMMFNHEADMVFILGLLLVSILSFWDDVTMISPSVRLVFQIISVSFLLYSSSFQFYLGFILLAILIVGIINAYNFMDGINGITVLYSATVTFSLIWARRALGLELSWYDDSLVFLFSAFFVFGFYNLRRIARCFAGDIGAVSLAFILSYGIWGVITQTSNPIYVLLLGVYGLDTVATITLRICRKENLTEAHRTHLYQFLSNEKGYSHISVAIFLSLAQLGLSAIIITQKSEVSLIAFGLIIFSYIGYRLKYQGFQNLFVGNKQSI